MSCPTLPLLLPMMTIPGLKDTVFTTFCSIGAGHHKSMKFYLIIKSFLNIFLPCEYIFTNRGETLRRGNICYRTQRYEVFSNSVELPAMNGLRISLLLVGLFIDGRWKTCGI